MLDAETDTPPLEGASLAVLFFGPLGDQFGSCVTAPIPPGGLTVRELRRTLAQRLGEGGDRLLSPAVRICIDRVIASEGALVRPGQEVAVLPVFSGG